MEEAMRIYDRAGARVHHAAPSANGRRGLIQPEPKSQTMRETAPRDPARSSHVVCTLAEGSYFLKFPCWLARALYSTHLTSPPMCVTELDGNLHHLDEPIQTRQEDGRRGRNTQHG